MNQTIVRSINTTLIALLPVGSILVVGTVVLGTGPLKDLSLALFVGIAVGAYSSIFIAPALLATFKEREPGMQALRRRVLAKRGTTVDHGLRYAGAGGRRSHCDGRERPDDPHTGPPGEGRFAGHVEPAGEVDELGRTPATDPQAAVQAR